jgi:predicted nuclease of predicted toxin-antitoxin system
MRILADENILGAAVQRLRDEGHDVLWIRESCPGFSDEAVIGLAIEDRRIIITFAKDFGELAVVRTSPLPEGIVLFRIVMDSPSSVAATVCATLASRHDWLGHIAVIDASRIRMRPLQQDDESRSD